MSDNNNNRGVFPLASTPTTTTKSKLSAQQRSNADDNDDDDGAANAAMNVFHSYHKIGDEIVKLQQERQVVEADTRSKRDEMQRLHDDMSKMERTQQAALQQRDVFHRKLQEMQQQQQVEGRVGDLSSLPDGGGTGAAATEEGAQHRAGSGGLSNKVKLEQLGRLVRESRETFRHESAEFRRHCTQLRHEANALGLTSATTTAFLAAHGINVPDSAESAVEPSTGMGADDLGEDDDDDPDQWTDADFDDDVDDDETKELWKVCVASRERLAQLENERDAAQSSLQEWTQKSAVRKDRVTQLEEQLRRVAQENEGLEAQLKELSQQQQSHKRARTTDVSTAPSAPVLPSTVRMTGTAGGGAGATSRLVANNPYAKKAATATAPSRTAPGTTTTTGAAVTVPSTADPRRRQLQAAVLGRSTTSTSSSRHFRPHVDFGSTTSDRDPLRRRRRDKRFGCDLVVQDGTTLDASWDDDPSPSPYDTYTPSPNNNNDRGGVTDAASSTSLGLTQPTTESSTSARRVQLARITPAPPTAAARTASSTTTRHRLFRDDDDDDDDDDDLLSRSVWASGRK